MKTYTIPPLVWQKCGIDSYQAYGVLGCWFELWKLSGGEWRLNFSDGWSAMVDTIDDGKAQAEAYYLSRLLPALVEVPAPDRERPEEGQRA